MTKAHFRIIFGILIVNIILLIGSLGFVTFQAVQQRRNSSIPCNHQSQTAVDDNQTKSNQDTNFLIKQWKIRGQLRDTDLAYDFRNGTGGNTSTSNQFISGESIWFYSKQLRAQIAKLDPKTLNDLTDPELKKGYLVIINRVNASQLANPADQAAFPLTIQDYKFNLADAPKLHFLELRQKLLSELKNQRPSEQTTAAIKQLEQLHRIQVKASYQIASLFGSLVSDN